MLNINEANTIFLDEDRMTDMIKSLLSLKPGSSLKMLQGIDRDSNEQTIFLFSGISQVVQENIALWLNLPERVAYRKVIIKQLNLDE